MKTLLKNGSIIAYDKGIIAYKNGYIGIQDDKIIYVSEEKPTEKYDVEKDMTNKLLIPGFINGHNHSPMTLLRGVGSELPLGRWLSEAILPVEAKLDKECIQVGSRVAIMEMIACGTTSFTDMYNFMHTTLEEVVTSKIKANLTRPVLSFDPNESHLDNKMYKESLEFYNSYNGYDNGRILVDFSIHAEYTSTEKVVKGYSDACNEYGGHMHIHLSETAKEHNECKEKYGKTPTEWFNDLGTFDSSAQAAHCVMVEDKDLEILKEKGVSVVHNPTSNMKLGSGYAPIKKMLDMGINVTLGTDGAASNNNLNLLEEMHIASLIHKGKANDPTIIKPAQLFEMATINGAKMQRRYDIGAISPGNKADIVAIDLDRPHMIPAFDLLTILAYSAQASDVCMTMVDGEIIYENNTFYTIDEEKTKFEFRKAIERLYK